MAFFNMLEYLSSVILSHLPFSLVALLILVEVGFDYVDFIKFIAFIESVYVYAA